MAGNFEELLEKIEKSGQDYDIKLIREAFEFANEAHALQLRESGEPYIIHPVEVACILADLEFDQPTIIAALLHDTIEDTKYTFTDIQQKFGDEIASLVEGVTKLDKIAYSSREEEQAENLRKMFLAMARDIRVVMIKLADRIHNMRTLSAREPSKQIEQAKETIEIYAPLAHRLGMYRIKSELEDLSLKYLEPEIYRELAEAVAEKKQERDQYIDEIIQTLRDKLNELGFKNAHIDGRAKHFYSIYKKMKNQHKTIDQIYDIFAVRIIVDTVQDCYAVLGAVHEIFKPVPGRVKDYIAMPKPNMYQSVHTILLGPNATYFEVQIRTKEMHRVAEFGIAAHWKYKEGNSKNSDMDSKLAWLRQFLEDQKEIRDEKDFMETLKVDLFSDRVYVFTPKGDVKDLSSGSCPIDFAYSIHSAVGNKLSGARVNGKIVTLDYKLQTGDMVEILTLSSIVGPSRDWLKIVKTNQARNKINQWFKKERREENIIRGKESIDRELKKNRLTHNQLFKNEWIEIILKKYNFQSLDDIYAAIGYGGITASKVVITLRDEYKKTIKPEEIGNDTEELRGTSRKKPDKDYGNEGIIVKDIDNCLVRISRCCNPLPGDSIVGYITRGRGVSVHRTDCKNITSEENHDERLIDVSWASGKKVLYVATLLAKGSDRPYLLMEVINKIGELKMSLKVINARVTKENKAIMNLSVEITDTEQLDVLIKNLRKIDGILEVIRSKQ